MGHQEIVDLPLQHARRDFHASSTFSLYFSLSLTFVSSSLFFLSVFFSRWMLLFYVVHLLHLLIQSIEFAVWFSRVNSTYFRDLYFDWSWAFVFDVMTFENFVPTRLKITFIMVVRRLNFCLFFFPVVFFHWFFVCATLDTDIVVMALAICLPRVILFV